MAEEPNYKCFFSFRTNKTRGLGDRGVQGEEDLCRSTEKEKKHEEKAEEFNINQRSEAKSRSMEEHRGGWSRRHQQESETIIDQGDTVYDSREEAQPPSWVKPNNLTLAEARRRISKNDRRNRKPATPQDHQKPKIVRGECKRKKRLCWSVLQELVQEAKANREESWVSKQKEQKQRTQREVKG